MVTTEQNSGKVVGDMGEVIGYEQPEGIDGNTLTFETP